MNIENILLYSVVAFFYITSPGPAIILAIYNGLKTNMKVVFISSSANILGLFILSSASILGLGTLLKTSALLFMIVKFIGAFYLIYLGIKFIKNSSVLDISDIDENINLKSNKSYFIQAFTLAITNPKPILFFTAIFPQFLDTSIDIFPQFAIMTLIFLIISFSSLCTYGFLAKKSRKLFKNITFMNIFHKITGGIFISMGLLLTQLKNN